MCWIRTMYKCYICQQDVLVSSVAAAICVVQQFNKTRSHAISFVYMEQPKEGPWNLCADCAKRCADVQGSLEKDFGPLK